MQELMLLPPQEIINIGNVFWQSGMFKDHTSAAQIIVKIQAGQEIGIPPFQAVSGIHMIQGKAEIGAHIIGAKVKASNKYDYRIIKHTAEVCELEFFEGKKSLGISSFSIEDARRAQTKNMEKFPRNMLFARAVSNGYRWFCPDIFSVAVYVHGEINGDAAEAEDTPATVTNSAPASQPIAQQAVPMQPEPAKLPALTKTDPTWPKVIEWLKTGGTIEGLRVRYSIDGETADLLRAEATIAQHGPSFVPQPMTQEKIHEANAGYQKPTEAIKQAEANNGTFDPNRPF
jgi:hypothetical protein